MSLDWEGAKIEKAVRELFRSGQRERVCKCEWCEWCECVFNARTILLVRRLFQVTGPRPVQILGGLNLGPALSD